MRRLRRPSPLTTALAVDALFEFVVGAALLAWHTNFGGWWEISSAAVITIGIVFIVAGAALVAMIATRVPAQQVRSLAIANIAGGAVGWLLFAVAYGGLAPEGRWLLAAISDCFIVIGLAELLIVQRASVATGSPR